MLAVSRCPQPPLAFPAGSAPASQQSTLGSAPVKQAQLGPPAGGSSTVSLTAGPHGPHPPWLCREAIPSTQPSRRPLSSKLSSAHLQVALLQGPQSACPLQQAPLQPPQQTCALPFQPAPRPQARPLPQERRLQARRLCPGRQMCCGGARSAYDGWPVLPLLRPPDGDAVAAPRAWEL